MSQLIARLVRAGALPASALGGASVETSATGVAFARGISSASGGTYVHAGARKNVVYTTDGKEIALNYTFRRAYNSKDEAAGSASAATNDNTGSGNGSEDTNNSTGGGAGGGSGSGSGSGGGGGGGGGNSWVRNPTVILLSAFAGTMLMYLPLVKSKLEEATNNTEQLRSIFNRYASVEKDGQMFMTRRDFISSTVGGREEDADVSFGKDTFLSLFGDTKDNAGDGSALLSFSDFVFFDTLLSTSSAQFQTVFSMFDTNDDGKLTKDEMTKVMKAAVLGAVDIDLDGEYWTRFFDKDGKGKITLKQFLKMVDSLKTGILYQEFETFAARNQIDDAISGREFASLLLVNIDVNSLPKRVATAVESLDVAYGKSQVTFTQFVEFDHFLDKIDKFSFALRRVASANDNSINREDFRRIARVCSGVAISESQMDVLFHLFSYDRRRNILDVETCLRALKSRRQRTLFDYRQLSDTRVSVSPIEALFKGAKSFALGGFAGAIGATVVYPIDLVKTRMQNQRTTLAGVKPAAAVAATSGAKGVEEIVYKNAFDCFAKVFKNEGLLGFYKGLGPQLVGVAPEKAIKLVVNDYLRRAFKTTSDDGTVAEGGVQGASAISLPLEILAGASAGASQVVFTNPLEIVKIRLQVQGELPASQRKGALMIVRDLGLGGIYKGASACFMRDIPFSAIYFPLYAALKERLRDDDGHQSPASLLVAGSIAGVFAASLTTPADVVKTRLQVEAKAGQTKYTGIGDVFVKVSREEGVAALFKGVLPRVFRSSPQFGVTLLSYELLQIYFGTAEDASSEPPVNANIGEDIYQFRESLGLDSQTPPGKSKPANEEDKRKSTWALLS